MSLQDKYRAVLELGQKLGVKDGYVEEAMGVLKIGGTAATQYDKIFERESIGLDQDLRTLGHEKAKPSLHWALCFCCSAKPRDKWQTEKLARLVLYQATTSAAIEAEHL